MNARKLITLALACIVIHFNASAQGLSAGLYNSPKGFGISLDHNATHDIINSYTVYADVYHMLSGKARTAGVKLVYLHSNRLSSIDTEYARFDFYLGPGASTGYVRDSNYDQFGLILTADVSFSIRVCFRRSFDMELTNVAELGFIAGDNERHTQLSIYDNGLLQALIPSLKLMIRF